MTATVAIAYTPAPAKQSPNLRSTTDAAAAATYYRAMIVAFASVRRLHQDVILTLVTNVEPPAAAALHLGQLGVQLVYAPFEHRPPDGFWPTFNASLYTIDAMRRLGERCASGQAVLLIDPDVLCTRDLSQLFGTVKERSILAYPTGFRSDEISQGLSALDAAPLHQKLDPGLVEPPVHYGGELYGFTRDSIRPVLERAEEAWELALDRWKSGKSHFVTEEHLLNYGLRGTTIIDATPFVRRISTAPTLRDVCDEDLITPLWHLPAEKDRAFAAYARAYCDEGSWFWRFDQDDFVRRAGALAGIPRRRPRRWLYDVIALRVRACQVRRQSAPGTVPFFKARLR